MSKQLCGNCGKKGDFFAHICEKCWRTAIPATEVEKLEKAFQKEKIDLIMKIDSLETYIRLAREERKEKGIALQKQKVATEAVSIEWLKEYCKKHEVKEGYGMMPFVHSHDIIKAAKAALRKQQDVD